MVKDWCGSIISILKKQKLNTKSLTEAELIRSENAMPQMLWKRYFLEAQGYGIGENILYHDNMRAMLLENNGNKYSTKNTKQINVRYYFIKDRVETGDVVTEHCPTEKMLGGHFTKPLQGALFSKFRVEIMNIPDELDMGEMVMDGKGLRRGSHINCIKGLTLDAHMSVLGILKNWKEKWCYGVLKYWST